MKSSFTGGCSCGSVRFECSATAQQIQMFKCHCYDCQKVSGGPFAAVVYVPAKTFRVTKGRIRHHLTPSEMMGSHRRGYCGKCGSRLTGGQGKGSTGIGMVAGSLDDPSRFKCGMHLWVSDAQPWDILEKNVPRYSKFPQKNSLTGVLAAQIDGRLMPAALAQ